MKFFDQLKNLSSYITEEIRTLEIECHVPPGTRPHLYVAAEKQLLEEVAEIKKLSSNLTEQAQSFKKFEEFLLATEELMQQKTEEINKLETYLMKYGYVAEVTEDPASAPPTPEPVAAPLPVLCYEFLSPELSTPTRNLLANKNTAVKLCHSQNNGKKVDQAPNACPPTTYSGPAVASFEIPAITTTRPSTDDELDHPDSHVPSQLNLNNSCTSRLTSPHSLINSPFFNASPTTPSSPSRNLATREGMVNAVKLNAPINTPKSELCMAKGLENSNSRKKFVTPRTRSNIENWLSKINENDYLHRKVNNPLLRNCEKTPSPHRTPFFTPKRQMGVFTTPKFPTSSSCLRIKPGNEGLSTLQPSFTGRLAMSVVDPASIRLQVPSNEDASLIKCNVLVPDLKPPGAECQVPASTLDLSLEEPTLSLATVNALAELRKANEREISPSRSHGRDSSNVSDLPISTFVSALKVSEEPIDYSCKSQSSALSKVVSEGNVHCNFSTMMGRVETPEEPILTTAFPKPENKRQIDTPEDPELIFKYSSDVNGTGRPMNHVDTPEEPVLSSASAPDRTVHGESERYVAAAQNNMISKTHSELLVSANSSNFWSTYNLQNVMNADIDQSPELSETTRQLLFRRGDPGAVQPTTAKGNLNDQSWNKENNLGPHTLSSTMESKFRRPAYPTSRPLEVKNCITADLSVTTDDFSDLDVNDGDLSHLYRSHSLVGRSRPAIDNSFSQAMLQYSHVPASPMPPPNFKTPSRSCLPSAK
ncbi:uncharacterized protein LOC108669710 [Hyalella azteca]|uniref:Uncharacterized protein LOC108669710 n=1 Tax=Hyalella azteca TaxID=294128 RepID=A0A8B7NG49_HYAAZ|nr:uncharacterized protein LOC108669710 [Hyalella azteca]